MSRRASVVVAFAYLAIIAGLFCLAYAAGMAWS